MGLGIVTTLPFHVISRSYFRVTSGSIAGICADDEDAFIDIAFLVRRFRCKKMPGNLSRQSTNTTSAVTRIDAA